MGSHYKVRRNLTYAHHIQCSIKIMCLTYSKYVGHMIAMEQRFWCANVFGWTFGDLFIQTLVHTVWNWNFGMSCVSHIQNMWGTWLRWNSYFDVQMYLVGPSVICLFRHLIVHTFWNWNFGMSYTPYTLNNVTGTGHAKYERSFPTCQRTQHVQFSPLSLILKTV